MGSAYGFDGMISIIETTQITFPTDPIQGPILGDRDQGQSLRVERAQLGQLSGNSAAPPTSEILLQVTEAPILQQSGPLLAGFTDSY